MWHSDTIGPSPTGSKSHPFIIFQLMLHNHMTQLFWSFLVIAAKYNESQTNSALRASIHCALCPDPSSLLTALSDANVDLEGPLNEFPQ